MKLFRTIVIFSVVFNVIHADVHCSKKAAFSSKTQKDSALQAINTALKQAKVSGTQEDITKLQGLLKQLNNTSDYQMVLTIKNVALSMTANYNAASTQALQQAPSTQTSQLAIPPIQQSNDVSFSIKFTGNLPKKTIFEAWLRINCPEYVKDSLSTITGKTYSLTIHCNDNGIATKEALKDKTVNGSSFIILVKS